MNLAKFRWKDNDKILINNKQFNTNADISNLHKYCVKAQLGTNGSYNYAIADCNERT